MIQGAVFSTAFLLLSGSSVLADQLTDCETPPGYVVLKTRADLPTSLQARFKDYAMPGEYYNKGDVGIPGRGVVWIWRNGRRWLLETGHGGFGSWFETEALDVSDDGKTATPLPPAELQSCAAIAKFASIP